MPEDRVKQMCEHEQTFRNLAVLVMATTFSPPFLREATGLPFTNSFMSWSIVPTARM